METQNLENVVAKLSSIDSINNLESLWDDFIEMSKQIFDVFLSRSQEEEIDKLLAPLFKQFIVKNCSSTNLYTLVKLCMEKSDEIKQTSISSEYFNEILCLNEPVLLFERLEN